MVDHLKKMLAGYESSVEFTGPPLNQMPNMLSQTDISVFPSIWENFPNVCLEACPPPVESSAAAPAA